MNFSIDKAVQVPYTLFQNFQSYLQAHSTTDSWAATLLERLQVEAIPVELDQSRLNTEEEDDIEF